MKRGRGPAWCTVMAVASVGCRPSPATPSPAVAPTADVQPAEPEESSAPDGYTQDVARWLGQRDVRYRRDAAQEGIALVRRGAVRLTHDGPRLGMQDGKQFSDLWRLRVVDDGEWPRVVTDDRAFRFLVYVDREDAHPMILERAGLGSAADESRPDAPDHGHVVLHAGAPVEIVGRKDDVVEVVYRKDDRRFSGWIAAHQVGTTGPGHEIPPPMRIPHLTTNTSTALERSPGKNAIVTLEKGAFVWVVAPDATPDRVVAEYRHLCELDISFVGFIPRAHLEKPVTGFGYNCATSGIRSKHNWGDARDTPREEVAAGRVILDDESGTVIGCVLRDAELAVLGDARYGMPTMWGPLPVRLAPPEFQAPCGTQK